MRRHDPFRPRPSRRWVRAVEYGALPQRDDGWMAAARRAGPLLWIGPLAAFTAVWMWDSGPASETATTFRGVDAERTSFGRCSGPVRTTCVVDGDTFWYQGTKIRVADIDAPEVSRPGCAREAALGEEATARLTALLNEGAFTLARATGSPDTDRYGRTLREVHRGGASVGATLVDEGLAEEWGGPRIAWC